MFVMLIPFVLAVHNRVTVGMASGLPFDHQEIQHLYIRPSPLRDAIERHAIQLHSWDVEESIAQARPHLSMVLMSKEFLLQAPISVLEGVTAHEVAHIAFRGWWFQYVVVYIGVFESKLRLLLILPASLMLANFGRSPDVLIVVPILFALLVLPRLFLFWASRCEEYAADAMASWYLGSIEPMKKTLIFIEEFEEARMLVPRLPSWCSTHPRHKRRLKALDGLQKK